MISNATIKGLHTGVCSSHNPLQDQEAINASSVLQVKEAYVSRGSTVAILLISNFLIRFP